MKSVKCAIKRVKCAMKSVKCAIKRVKCAMNSVKCAIKTCEMCNETCEMCNKTSEIISGFQQNCSQNRGSKTVTFDNLFFCGAIIPRIKTESSVFAAEKMNGKPLLHIQPYISHSLIHMCIISRQVRDGKCRTRGGKNEWQTPPAYTAVYIP